MIASQHQQIALRMWNPDRELGLFLLGGLTRILIYGKKSKCTSNACEGGSTTSFTMNGKQRSLGVPPIPHKVHSSQCVLTNVSPLGLPSAWMLLVYLTHYKVLWLTSESSMESPCWESSSRNSWIAFSALHPFERIQTSYSYLSLYTTLLLER